MADPPPARTDWAEIGALLAAGIAGALQLGKVAPALLAIGEGFGIGLTGAAALMSVFALMAAAMGLPAGLIAARAGVRRALLAGLGALGAAGLAAAAAPTPALLYAARAVEGVGFLAVVVSAPALVAARAAAPDRNLAMAAWSTFMPAGVALGLAAAPLVERLGWRPAWTLAALLAWVAAGLVLARVPRGVGAPEAVRTDLAERLAALWRAGAPLRVAACFAAYTVIYFGIAGFLPARLVEGFGLSLSVAGLAGAVAAVANIGGNLVAGGLMRQGAHPAAVAMAAGGAMTVLAAAAFALPVPPSLAVGAALLASGIGGAVPASLFALVPRAVPEPALTGPALGLTVQCNNLAQVLGPIAIAAAARQDWALAALPLLAAGAALLLLAPPLRRLA